mgnify:CR=1 FL=1
MTDPSEDICDALVTFARALTAPDVSLTAAEVRKSDNPLKELDGDQPLLKVFFHASSEDAERIGRGAEVLEHFVITMLVVRKLNAEFTKQVLAIYTRELKAAIRGQRMAGYPQTAEATPVKVDSQQIFDRQQFCSITEFTYSKAGTA